MKRYRPLSSVLTWVRIRCFSMGSRQYSDNATFRGRNREDVALFPKSVHARSYLGLRLYSSGSLGVNRVWTGFDENRPSGAVEIPEPCNDFYQSGNFSQANGSMGFRQNEVHFQHPSSSVNQNTFNGRTDIQSLSYNTREKTLDSGHFTAGNGAAYQQIGGNMTTNSGTGHQNPSYSFSENGAGHHQGGYQQTNIGPHTSLDAYHPPNHGPHRQSSSGNNYVSLKSNVSQSLNYNTREKCLDSGHFTAGNGAAYQQIGGNLTTNSGTGHQNPSYSFCENGAGHHQGGYQQTNIGPHTSLDAYHPPNHGPRWQSSSGNNYVPLKSNVSQSLNYNTREKSLDSGHFTAGNGAAFQQNAGHLKTKSGTGHQNPSYSFSENGAGCHPGGYQQTNIGPHASLDAHHPPNHVPHWQSSSENNYAPRKSNVSHNSNFISQPHLKAATDVHSGENDDYSDVEGTLEELDALCKDWDLERAVKSMKMLSERGVGIDLSRYLLLIEACGDAKALTEGKAVHQHMVKFLCPVSVSTFNRILVMYGKCGSMVDAYDVFDQMCERNLTSWDTMITWYGRNGLGEEAIDMFSKFKEAGLKPDDQIFIGVFDACGVVGDITEGLLHFDSMSKIYGITPTMAHYVSIVHMFGSAGDLDGALEFIEKMPLKPSADIWETLMNISRIQGNIELGDRCAQIVEQLDPLLLTKETKFGLLPVEESDSRKKKVKKINPLEQRQHEYRAGDRSHPENDKIYTLLRGMKESMKEAGYIPETRFVLHDIDPEGKEEAIMAHSERLACAYALMTTKPRMPIRILKNLRVCVDCHNVFKIISKIVGREVIMRDAKRFHHFRDGKCSCNDYW